MTLPVPLAHRIAAKIWQLSQRSKTGHETLGCEQINTTRDLKHELWHLLFVLLAQGKIIAFQDKVLVRQLLAVGFQGSQAVSKRITLPGDPLVMELDFQNTILQGQHLGRNRKKGREQKITPKLIRIILGKYQEVIF